MGDPEVKTVRRDQLGTGVLLGVARRLERAKRREGVHAVNHARFFHGRPQGLILGLNRIVAHRVDGADKRHTAALGRHAIELLGGKYGVLHGQHRGKENPLGVRLTVLVGPLVVGFAHGFGADGILQPRIGIDVGGNDHHLVNALDVHVAQARLGFVGAFVIHVVGLLFGEGSLGVQVAHVEGPLDVMLEARPGRGENIDDPRRPADTLGPETRTRVAIDNQLLGLGIKPHGGLESFQLVFGQPVF